MLHFDEKKHIYTLNGQRLPSVTQILVGQGFIDTHWFTDYGRDRGTYVHKIIQYHCAGELDESSIDPALWPYFKAWLQFEIDTTFVSVECEIPCASEAHRFAGTPDHVGFMNGVECVIDVKSGADLPAAEIQTAGYAILKNKPLKRYSLRLMNNGRYSLREHVERSDSRVFLAALSCWWWKEKNLKGANNGSC